MISMDKALLAVYIVVCYQRQAKVLHEFYREDSKSQCTTGLLSNVDVVVFKFRVDHSKDPLMKFVNFKIRTLQKEYDLIECNIQENCKSSQNAFGKRTDKYVIEIHVTVNATHDLNKATIQAFLYPTNEKPVRTKVLNFPAISDASEASVKLTVNGRAMNITECRDHISGNNLTITAKCESEVKPCWIEMLTNDSNDFVQDSDKVIMDKKVKSTNELNVLIRYYVCNPDTIQTIICTVTFDGESQTGQGSIDTDTFTYLHIVLPTILCICLIFSFLFCCWKNNKFRVFLNGIFRDRKSSTPQNPKNSNELTSFLHHDANKIKEYETEIHKPKHESDIGKEQDDLNMDFQSCSKEETHKNYIPIWKLKRQQLPSNYKNTGLFEVIKIMADLSVRISSTFISLHRPDVYQETQNPYPYFDKRGESGIVRLGTGFIKRVKKIEDSQSRCICHKCQHSETPSERWGKIYISTSRSLVFDKSEALKTTVRVFYDEKNDNYHCIDGSSVKQIHEACDHIEIECVTCDEELLNRLMQQTECCKKIMKDLNTKYQENKFDDNLTIIVSHPHGCPKHVSIGTIVNRWVVKNSDGKLYTKYVYTTPTCNGCIGAFVYVVGASDISLIHHTHFGMNKDKINYSTTGMEHALNCN